MKTKTFIMIFLLAIILDSCVPAAKVAPTEITTPQSTLTITPPSPITNLARSLATPTDIQLPFNDKNVESVYCQSPAIRLSISDAQSLTDDEIAGKLMSLWISYFNAPQAPDWCRIDGYKIDKVYYDKHALSFPPIEPQGDIMRVVQFSIKLIQIPNMWMSWAGEIDKQNWLHTGNALAVFRSNNGYTMKFAYP